MRARRPTPTSYEYSLPLMLSLLNPSCVVELILYRIPLQGKELILIADTFIQLKKVDFSLGSLVLAVFTKDTFASVLGFGRVIAESLSLDESCRLVPVSTTNIASSGIYVFRKIPDFIS
ncbi:hypothetical protein Ddc_00664 [Ditylenchus destructor]|nr:hypothetical protein Ddc_00664 [Ditylenchus destructor]